MRSIRGKSTSKKKLNKIETNQLKITKFFTNLISNKSDANASTHSAISNVTPNLATPKSSQTNAKSLDNRFEIGSDDDDILEVTEVQKHLSPKELIIIASSDSDSDEVRANEPNKTNAISSTSTTTATKSPCSTCTGHISPDLFDVVPSETNKLYKNLNTHCGLENHSANTEVYAPGSTKEINTGCDVGLDIEVGANKSINDRDGSFSGSDSGDDVLSQLDVDEIVRLSQSSCGSRDQFPPLLLTTPHEFESPKKENNCQNATNFNMQPPPFGSTAKTKTPLKSPKSQLNKFSPIRHMRKRTSSAASLDSPNKRIVKSNSSSPNISKHPNEILPLQNSNSRKKLDFNNSQNNTSNTGINREKGPYYLRNFMNILTEVVSDTFHAHLIHQNDHNVVQSFNQLSLNAQSLYVRLFQRKWGWKALNKINNNYKELPEDVSDLCAELSAVGFLEKISPSNANIEEVLDTLDLTKTTSLAKKMMISSTKKTKEAFKEALLNKTKRQKTLTGCGTSTLMKAALSELGSAFRVTSSSKTLFSRLFILFSPPQYWEVENDQASNQLLVILLNNMGQMEYPSYKIKKSTIIYRNREDLIRFHEAWCLHSNIVAFCEQKNWEAVVETANQALNLLQMLLDDNEFLLHDRSLPNFLRIYSAGSVLSHTCWMGVDGFQKLKEFSSANKFIELLLKQTQYLTNYRGRLHERLVINANHLKKSKYEIKELLEKALKDNYLRDNHKLVLSGRLEKIKFSIDQLAIKRSKPKTTKRRKNKAQLAEDDLEDTEDVLDIQNIAPENKCEIELFLLNNTIPTRNITGEKMDRGPGNMGKAVFISRRDTIGSNRITSVEGHAIDYYLENGYTAGIHGEGATVTTMYGLLFWDIIFYDEIPDAFHTRYQPFPLDMHFEDFYIRRKDMIDEKLELIRCLSVEDLCTIIDNVWEQNEKKLSIVNWAMFENRGVLKGLMKAMGSQMIANICERLAKNYRFSASGFPDLVVWNDSQVLFVEVKGPGDSLSPKQQLWLDFLISNEIPAEVCHVKAVSNKRIRLE